MMHAAQIVSGSASGPGAVLTALTWALFLLCPGAAAQAERSEALERFVERFQTAFGSDDQQKVYELFYWEGVDAEDRYRISLLITRDLRDRLVATRLEPSPPERAETRPPLNLPVVAQLRARFVSGNGVAHDSVHQLGVSEGRIYIALPVSTSRRDRSI